MIKTRFITLLKILSSQEVEHFHNYLKSHHSKQKVALQIFEYIKPFYPKFEKKPELEKRYAYQKIFKGEEFKNSKISNALSDLSIRLENFLIINKIESQPTLRNIFLMEVFRERVKNELFNTQKKRTEKVLKGESFPKGVSYYFEQMMVHHLDYHRTFRDKLDKGIINELIQADTNLDLSYYLRKLQYLCELGSRNELTNEMNNFAFSEDLLGLLQKKYSKLDLISHKAYTLALKLILQKKEVHFNNLFEYLKKNYAYITTRDVLALIMYLINFAAQRIRSREFSYYQKSFDVYDFGHDNNLFAKDGLIDNSNFNNAIVVSCTIGEFEWAQIFLEKWKKNLHESIRTDTILLSIAKIHFEKEDYKQTLNLLKNAKFKMDYDKLRAKLMELRSYWLDKDQYSDSFVLDQIRNFESFIKRNKSIGDSVKQGFMNFVKVFRQIVRQEQSKSEINVLLQNYKEIVCKDWLEKELSTYQSFLYRKG